MAFFAEILPCVAEILSCVAERLSWLALRKLALHYRKNDHALSVHISTSRLDQCSMYCMSSLIGGFYIASFILPRLAIRGATHSFFLYYVYYRCSCSVRLQYSRSVMASTEPIYVWQLYTQGKLWWKQTSTFLSLSDPSLWRRWLTRHLGARSRTTASVLPRGDGFWPRCVARRVGSSNARFRTSRTSSQS